MTTNVFEAQEKYASKTAFDAVSDEVSAARDGQANLDTRLDLMTTATTDVSDEVTAARDGYASLDTRLTLMTTATTDVSDEVAIARDSFPNLDARLDSIAEGATPEPGMFMALAPLNADGDLILPVEYGATATLLEAYTPGDGQIYGAFDLWPGSSSGEGYGWISIGAGSNLRIMKGGGPEWAWESFPFWERFTIPIGEESIIYFTAFFTDPPNPAGNPWPVGTPIQHLIPITSRPYVQISGRPLETPAGWTETTARVVGTTVDKSVVDPALLPPGTESLALMVVVNEAA